jgi:hypothetical protein
MNYEVIEPCENHPTCELILGTSSWDGKEKSAKFSWKDKLGRRCRGGEVPVDALPQLLNMAIEHGYLKLDAK